MTSTNIDPKYLLDTLRAMIRINSVLPHERPLADFVGDEIRRIGLVPQFQEVSPGRPNIYATADFGGEGKFLVFSGHSDTVGAAADWITDPFEPVEMDGRLYGLGAINMKGGLACSLGAFRFLAQNGSKAGLKGRLGLAVTVDQEGLSAGAEAFLKTEYSRCDAMLHAEHFFGDSPENYLPSGGTGKILYRLIITGRTAHAFRPHEGGINAVDDAAMIIRSLDKMNLRIDRELGKGTYCILNIHGGPAQYSMVVPDRCEMLITRLTVRGETRDVAIRDMRDLVASLNLKSTVEIETPPPAYDPYRLDIGASVLPIFKAVYRRVIGKEPHFAAHRGITDANVFVAGAGIPTIVFGPKGANHHMAGEYVEIDSLVPVAKIYAETAIQFLS